MAKYVTVADNLGVSYRRSAALPIDDRSAVMNADDLWKRSTWITETDSVVKLYAGIIVSAIGDGDQGTAGLYYLVADKSGSHRAAVAFEYMWSDSDNAAPGAVSGTDVSAPGKSTSMGWRKLSFGSDFKFPDAEGDYILVVDNQGNATFTRDKRLVPIPGTNDVAGMILTVTDDGNGELSYGWESFWLPKPSVEGDYVLRRDANGNFTWVLSSSGSAEDTIGINIEGIYEDDGSGYIQPKSGASTTRKETLSNTGAVVAVEEGQAADGKFRLEIPVINGGDAWGDTGTIPSPTPTPVFNPQEVVVMVDNNTVDILGTTDNVIPASMSSLSIPTPTVPTGAAVRYTENFNIIPGYTTTVSCTSNTSDCKVMIWAGTWIDCFSYSQDQYGVWTVTQADGNDVIAPDLACIILTPSNNTI